MKHDVQAAQHSYLQVYCQDVQHYQTSDYQSCSSWQAVQHYLAPSKKVEVEVEVVEVEVEMEFLTYPGVLLSLEFPLSHSIFVDSLHLQNRFRFAMSRLFASKALLQSTVVWSTTLTRMLQYSNKLYECPSYHSELIEVCIPCVSFCLHSETCLPVHQNLHRHVICFHIDLQHSTARTRARHEW